MATLDISYQGSGTLYIVVRRQSDQAVWNGSAFVVWADGDIASYDVPMTSAGGDLYTVTFPDAIAAGDYIVFFYEQSGGSPATSDLILRAERYHWNGAALSEDSDVDLSAYALTTLEGVKRHLRITVSTYDTLLTELINAVSAKIETITARRFKARDYRRWLGTDSQNRMVLPDFPVQHITQVAYGASTAMTVNFGGSAIRANASVYKDPESYEAGGLRLVTYASNGTKTANNLAFASYPSLSALETAVEAVTGWTATVAINRPSYDLRPTGAEDALGRDVTLHYPDQDLDTYRIKGGAGLIEFDTRAFPLAWLTDRSGATFPPSVLSELLIEYRAGYETIPADVDFVAREMVKEMYMAGTQNTGVKSTKLGPYAVTFSDTQEQFVRSRLAVYMDANAMIGGLP